jgi:hypothetical protein
VDKIKILGLLEFLAATVEYTEKLESTHEKSWEKLLAWAKRGSRRRVTYANFIAVAEKFQSDPRFEPELHELDSRDLTAVPAFA